MQNCDRLALAEELEKKLNLKLAKEIAIAEGKYKGKLLGEIYLKAPQIIEWYALTCKGKDNLVRDGALADNCIPCVDLEIRHHTYSVMLSLLSLKDSHKVNLKRRGLTEEQIEKLLFKSVPATGFKKLAADLLRYTRGKLAVLLLDLRPILLEVEKTRLYL